MNPEEKWGEEEGGREGWKGRKETQYYLLGEKVSGEAWVGTLDGKVGRLQVLC